ncbi:hypothetical protein BLNAU_1851 [Blattamonas nauphoetae]|uniref:Uncharacterized protein n=1 Tax=Blattamonas nauphoetae TaxID=2049346 RepID=A0ABQ9YHT4_9EUKA|nr:hypothetical protein BLNAU_1851 [Blattamonas nauphoetae]
MIVKWFVEGVLELWTTHKENEQQSELTDEDCFFDDDFSFHLVSPSVFSSESTFSSNLSVLSFHFCVLVNLLSSHSLLVTPLSYSCETILDSFFTSTIVKLSELGIVKILLPPLPSNHSLLPISLLPPTLPLTFFYPHRSQHGDHSIKRTSKTKQEVTQLDLFRLFDALILDFSQFHIWLVSCVEHRFLSFVNRDALNEPIAFLPRLVQTFTELLKDTSHSDWEKFAETIDLLAVCELQKDDADFLVDSAFYHHLPEVLDELQKQMNASHNPLTPTPTTSTNTLSNTPLTMSGSGILNESESAPSPRMGSESTGRSGSSLPFDENQSFISLRDRVPSLASHHLSQNPSVPSSEKSAIFVDSHYTTSTKWGKVPSEGEKESLRSKIELIHSLLSKRVKKQFHMPSFSSPVRLMTIGGTQGLIERPEVFTSAIFGLDEVDLLHALLRIAGRQTIALDKHFILADQEFIDGLVECLQSPNESLSRLASSILMAQAEDWSAMIHLHVAALLLSFTEGTPFEQDFTLGLIHSSLMTKRITTTDPLFHMIPFEAIALRKWDDLDNVGKAIHVIGKARHSTSTPPHSTSLVKLYAAFVGVNDVAESIVRIQREEFRKNKEPLSSWFLEEALFILFTLGLPCRKDIVDYILSTPSFCQICSVDEWTFSPRLLASFPFDVLFERLFRSTNHDLFIYAMQLGTRLVSDHQYPTRSAVLLLHPFYLRGYHLPIFDALPSLPSRWLRPFTASFTRCLLPADAVPEQLFFDTLAVFQSHPVPRLFSFLVELSQLDREMLVPLMFLPTFRNNLLQSFGECKSMKTLCSILTSPTFNDVDQTRGFDISFFAQCALVASHSIPPMFDNPLLALFRSCPFLVHSSSSDVHTTLSIMKGGPLSQRTTTHVFSSRRGHFNKDNEAIHFWPRAIMGEWVGNGEGLVKAWYPDISAHPAVSDHRLFLVFLFVLLHQLQTPSLTSVILLALHNHVLFCPQAELVSLMRDRLIDTIIRCVSQSEYLEDYEHGCAVVAAVLRAVQKHTPFQH